MARRLAVMGAVVAIAAIGATGCGGSADDSGARVSAPVATVTETSTTAAAGAKVSANTGTADEIQAALEAAGVANAERWTREVMEYRPYDGNDPTLAQLRQELLKYNPAADELERILGALQT